MPARSKRIALSAVAVTVGAIVLSGCVVIQSESALQANVIGNTRDGHDRDLREPGCGCGSVQQPGQHEQVRRQRAERDPGRAAARRLPHPRGRRRAGDDLDDRARPTAPDGSPTTATLTLTQSPSYTSGLTAIAPPPAGSQWVGYVSERERYAAAGQQSVTITPTFGLPAGFVGPFTWRTVVGYRPALDHRRRHLPGAFPGVMTSPIPGQVGVVRRLPRSGHDQQRRRTLRARRPRDPAAADPDHLRGLERLAHLHGPVHRRQPVGRRVRRRRVDDAPRRHPDRDADVRARQPTRATRSPSRSRSRRPRRSAPTT